MLDWLRKDHNALLFFILIAAAHVRFAGFWDLGFHHDELSALLRTRFDSFGELIDKGVRIDGHPAGVQVFLYLWTGIGGFGNIWVKLPFLLAGLASVYLIYRVGLRLFGDSEGFFAAALLATLQYGVLYSQWARPYAFGLFFVLLFAYALLRLRNSPDWRKIILVAIAAAGAGYTHYFALLQVLIIGLAALPFLKRKTLLSFLAAGAFGVVLWLPHIGITLDHLKLGGIGDWLKKPDKDYWLQLLDFSVHYSWWMKGGLIALLLASLVFATKSWSRYWSHRLTLVVLIVVPYLIAYFYSHEVSALLHHGTAFFAFPFLLLLVASFMGWTLRVGRIAIPAIVFIAVITLRFERDHRSLNYETEYQESLEWLAELNEKAGKPLYTFVDLRRDAVAMMFDEQVVPRSAVQFIWPLYEESRIADYLNSIQSDSLFVVMSAGSQPEYLAAAFDRFSCILEVKYFSSGSAYLPSNCCNSLEPLTDFGVVENELLTLDANFSHGLEGTWGDLEEEGRDLFFKASWTGPAKTNATLALETNVDFWRGVNTRPFASNEPLMHTAYHLVVSEEMPLKAKDRWKAFVWLEQGSTLRLQKLEVFGFPANPMKFRLFLP